MIYGLLSSFVLFHYTPLVIRNKAFLQDFAKYRLSVGLVTQGGFLYCISIRVIVFYRVFQQTGRKNGTGFNGASCFIQPCSSYAKGDL